MAHEDFWFSGGILVPPIMGLHAYLAVLFGYFIIELESYSIFLYGALYSAALTAVPLLVFLDNPADTEERAKEAGFLVMVLSIINALWNLIGTWIMVGFMGDDARVLSVAYLAIASVPLVLTVLMVLVVLFCMNTGGGRHQAIPAAPYISEDMWQLTMRSNDSVLVFRKTFIASVCIAFCFAMLNVVVRLSASLSGVPDVAIWMPLTYIASGLGYCIVVVMLCYCMFWLPVIPRAHIEQLDPIVNLVGSINCWVAMIGTQVAALVDAAGDDDTWVVVVPLMCLLGVQVLVFFGIGCLRCCQWRVTSV